MADFSLQEPINVKSAVDILIERLTGSMIDGTYKAGDRIPTETELAEKYGVSRNTVREALKTLVAYGILETRRPSGTYICSKFSLKSMNPLLYGMILQSQDSYGELIGLRKVIELGTLVLLCEKEDVDQKALWEACDALERACLEERPDAIKILTLDIAFHNALTKATGNRLLIEINEMINRLTYTSREKTIRKVIRDNELDYLIQTHRRFLDVLPSGDMEQFKEAVQDSFRYWKDINK